MNEDAINDLKQFITVIASQQTADIREDIDDTREDIKKLDNKLSRKIDELSDSVATAITVSNDEIDKQLKDHETRITAFETKST